MPFDAGAVVGEAFLKTDKWSAGVGVIDKTAKKLANFTLAALKVGFTAVAAGMAASIYQANEYQKEFANVSTLTDQNTESLQKMSIGLLKLDSSLGTTRELTRSMYDAISAGAAPGAEALKVVADSAKFAKASLADNAASVKLLSAATNAYGKENLDSSKAADVFFTTIKQGVITGEELASTIGQSIPLFASMQIPVEQLASGMAAMTKQGVSASESTTQLNAIINSFLKPSEALNQILEEQGYQSGQAFIQAEGLTGALDLLKNATEGGNVEIAELTPNIRAMRGVMALSGQGAIEYNNTLKEMANSAGAVNTAFQKQEKTFATFKAELGKTSIIVGNIGKFFVDDIAGGAQNALEAINDFLTSAKGLNAFSTIAAKIGGAFSIIKTFGIEVFNLFKDDLFAAIDDIKTTFNELFPSMINSGDAFNFIADAVDFVGAGLNIVIAVLKIFATNMINVIRIAADLGNVLADLWAVIKGEKDFGDVKDSLKKVGKAYAKAFVDMGNNVVGVVKEVQEQWGELTDEEGTSAAAFASSWKEGSEAARKAVEDNYLAAISGVKKGAEEGGDAADKLGDKLGDAADKGADAEGDATKKKKDYMKSWNEFVKDSLKTNFEKFQFWAGQVLDLGMNMFSGLSEISSMHYQNEKDKLTIATDERINALDEQAASEQEILTNKLDAGLITEEEFNTQSEVISKKHAAEKEKIEKETAKKMNDIAKKQFKAQKAFNIGQTWMDAARASLGFWAWAAPKGPPAWAVAGVMTAATLGMAAGKTVQIAKQQFVPSYASGTDSAPGGLANVGEKGIELVGDKNSNLVELARGAQVLPNNITEGLLFGGNSNETNININNPIVREENDIQKIVEAVSYALGNQMRTA